MKNEYEIVIKVDCNDGDYLTEVSPISKADIDRFRPLIKAIKDSPLSCNFEYGEYGNMDILEVYKNEPDITEDIIQTFIEFCPYGEHGFHTIESIMVYLKPKKETLL